MENKAAVFFVTEEEYPKLQAACPGDFPFTYRQFAARIDEGIKNTKGFTVVKVYVDVDEFLAWCAETEVKPISTARAQYAAMLLNRRLH
jgi:hypothetical protein